MKFVFLLVAVLTLGSTTSADIKVLKNINIADAESSSDAKISLNNEELIIEGRYSQTLYGAKVAPYQLITIYVADKNGYYAKFTLEPGSGLLVGKYLSAKSLQSVTG